MAHVWQHQKGLFLPLRRFLFSPYTYSLTPGKALEHYGIEQQAEIIRHAFLLRNGAKIAGAENPLTTPWWIFREQAMPHDVDHEAILDRLAATRGGVRNSFTDIDPARTAHLIIDMQNGFMEEGAPVEVPMAREVVGNINRISAAIRKAGGRNVFVRFTTPPEGSPSWSNFHFRMGPAAGGHKDAFTPGAHYWQLWPGPRRPGR